MLYHVQGADVVVVDVVYQHHHIKAISKMCNVRPLVVVALHTRGLCYTFRTQRNLVVCVYYSFNSTQCDKLGENFANNKHLQLIHLSPGKNRSWHLEILTDEE